MIQWCHTKFKGYKMTAVFTVSERFEFLADTIDMIATRSMKSAIIVGDGGLGKSFSVFRQLHRNGYTEMTDAKSADVVSVLDQLSNSGITNLEKFKAAAKKVAQTKVYVTVKGYSTPKGLYRTLYENRNSVIVFDDCDKVLEDKVAVNLLKAALDSYSTRTITWNSESFSDLPKSFEFTGSVVFISNLPMDKIPQALISRTCPIDVTMTRHEILTRMEQIIAEGEFMSHVIDSIKKEAISFIADNIDNENIKTINLRTLSLIITNLQCKPNNWKNLSLSMMMCAR